MRTPEQLRLDYIKNSGNWLKWIKEVQNEAYNQALQDIADDDLLPDKKRNLEKYRK
jgi:hypothetical protein